MAAMRERRPGRFILHWYSGSLKDLRAAIDAGAFFSVNAAMVRSSRGQRLIQEIPRDRVLTESDGPFVELEGKPASPESVRETVGSLARIWDADAVEAQQVVLDNFRNLLQGLSNMFKK